LVDVDGCFNVRDAGGWTTADGGRTRAGVLFRADEPNRLTTRGRAVIEGLRLRAVIDLRSRHHFERGGGFGAADITHNVPIVDRVITADGARRIDEPGDIAALYEEMVEQHHVNVVRAVALIADAVTEGPVLVHCMAGKDRTGIVVALVQAALGVGLDSIVEDYARSDEPTRLRRIEMIANPLPGDPAVAAAPELMWTAPAEAMRLFVERAVERHGSLDAWPEAIGVPRASIARLRQALCDPLGAVEP
jgi:protein-tyrosine phosphatase